MIDALGYRKSTCRCEHVAHFENGGEDGLSFTPNGKVGHVYGAEREIVAVLTTYGTFNVCADCADDCYKEFPRKGV